MSTGNLCYQNKNGVLVQLNVPNNKIRVNTDSRGRYAEHVSGDWRVYIKDGKIEFANGDTYEIISTGCSQSADPYGRKRARQ